MTHLKVPLEFTRLKVEHSVQHVPRSPLHRLQRAVGNQAVQRAVQDGVRIGESGDAHEQEAKRIEEEVAVSASRAGAGAYTHLPNSSEHHSPTSGQGLDDKTRTFMEHRLGHDLGHVRLHIDTEAARSAGILDARAYTVGSDIVFGAGQYAPSTPAGQRLLAHELAHTVQANEAGGRVIWRQTAQELISQASNQSGELDKPALARELVDAVQRGQYSLIGEALDGTSWFVRDDVVLLMLQRLTVVQLITEGHDPAALIMYRRMVAELGSGWTSDAEQSKIDLLSAILNEGSARFAWNRARIEAQKGRASSDLEALAMLFDDDQIVDDGTISGRLRAILDATEHLVVPGLQTGVEYSDTGFAGDQTPGGPGFRDPHPSSRNQVGHFLTAVGLQFTPEVVSRPVPLFGKIRDLVHAPAAMSDSEVALRLTIGHEKAPDPNGTLAAIDVVATGVVESLLPGPEDETNDQRDERIARAGEEETQRQINAIIRAFRTQFEAATAADIQAWNDALAALGTDTTLNMAGAEAPLRRISIDYTGRGNSIQDLRLSLVGWRLGQMLANHEFAARAQVANWIRVNLSASPPATMPPTPRGDFEPLRPPAGPGSAYG